MPTLLLCVGAASANELSLHARKDVFLPALGLMYRLTQEQRFAERAWTELDSVTRFKDWNLSHFLDTPDMTSPSRLVTTGCLRVGGARTVARNNRVCGAPAC